MLQGQPKGLYALSTREHGRTLRLLHDACDFHIILASEIRLYGRWRHQRFSLAS